ncbi:hypothetical protein AAAK34_10020 [Ottowia caeni]
MEQRNHHNAEQFHWPFPKTQKSNAHRKQHGAQPKAEQTHDKEGGESTQRPIMPAEIEVSIQKEAHDNSGHRTDHVGKQVVRAEPIQQNGKYEKIQGGAARAYD